MSAWNRNKADPSQINKGKEFTKNDILTVEELNAMVNNSFYGADVIDNAMVTPIVETTDVNADPTVEMVDYIKDGKTYKKFKFKNIKGRQGERGEKGEKGETGSSYVLTDADKEQIAEETANNISYVQPNEPTDAPDNALWIDTDEESDSVPQNLICKMGDGISVIDTGLEYSRGVVEVRKIGSILWLIESGVYNFTSSFTAKNNRTVLQFDLPKSLSNKIHNTNGAYGTTGTICYFPALAYENVTYTTFNCQSYLKRSAIGDQYDTFQLVYTGLSSISGGGLCGFHSKMPIILVDNGGNN